MTQITEIKVIVNTGKCCYCGACVSVCPVPEGALDLDETILRVNQELCIACGRCAKICPVGALTVPRAKAVLEESSSKSKIEKLFGRLIRHKEPPES